MSEICQLSLLIGFQIGLMIGWIIGLLAYFREVSKGGKVNDMER